MNIIPTGSKRVEPIFWTHEYPIERGKACQIIFLNDVLIKTEAGMVNNPLQEDGKTYYMAVTQAEKGENVEYTFMGIFRKT